MFMKQSMTVAGFGCRNLLSTRVGMIASTPYRDFSFKSTPNQKFTNLDIEPKNLKMTLKQFQSHIQKNVGDEAASIEFYSITGAKLPLSEKVQDLREFPIICQVNKNRLYAVNFSDEIEISKRNTSIKDQEHYFDFAYGLGLKKYELFSLSYLSHRLQMSLPDNKKTLTKDDVNQGIANSINYLSGKAYMQEEKDLNVFSKDTKEIMQELVELKKKFETE